MLLTIATASDNTTAIRAAATPALVAIFTILLRNIATQGTNSNYSKI